MNKIEVKHRDSVLRAYFEGRDWDRNNEYALKRKFVTNSETLMPNYPYLIDDEWEVESSRTEKGKGDLLFTDGAGRFSVVEVKWIDLEGPNGSRTGSTRRDSNRKKKKQVKEQAVKYAQALGRLLDSFSEIEGYSYTNEGTTPQLQTKLTPDDIPEIHE
ncbi:hypothetical protein IQ273_24745 [Nodosilinea sp. LEGE 07298]|uniref:hypothetical protein n=1 Tax=Nodosilinea sp. LEGE 07298 TaxID=2777970 RepID=UPI0018803E47|nr:hypothetical protein [Nodosilinea sp. LEGE 07298]MBE9112604.1 hypothetical protein [Nodosilinea sp. LEGE 07298]